MRGKFNTETFDKLIEKGSKASREGNQKAAIKSFQQALKETKKRGSTGRARVIANFKLGAAYFRKRNHKDAFRHLIAVYEDTERSSLGKEHEIILLGGLGTICHQRNEYDKAELLLREAIELETSLGIAQDLGKTTLMGLLVGILSETSRKEEAISLAEETFELMNNDRYSKEKELLERVYEETLSDLGLTDKLNDYRMKKELKKVSAIVGSKPGPSLPRRYDLPESWTDDWVSHFIDVAFRNAGAGLGNNELVWNELITIDAQFRNIIMNLKDHIVQKLAEQNSEGVKFDDLTVSDLDWLEIFFLMRCHSSWLGSVNLCAQGQLTEAHMVLRGCMENAMYAYWVYRNPKVKKYWFERNSADEVVRERARRSFSIKDISNEMKKNNVDLNKESADLYELLIQMGGHPNVSTFLNSAIQINEDKTIRLSVSYMNPDDTDSIMPTVLRTAKFCFWIFTIVFPAYAVIPLEQREETSDG